MAFASVYFSLIKCGMYFPTEALKGAGFSCSEAKILEIWVFGVGWWNEGMTGVKGLPLPLFSDGRGYVSRQA